MHCHADDTTSSAEPANGEVQTSAPTNTAVDAEMADPAESVGAPSPSHMDDTSSSANVASLGTDFEQTPKSPTPESTDVEHTHDTQ